MNRSKKDALALENAILNLSIFDPKYRVADKYNIKVLNLVGQKNLEYLRKLIANGSWELILNDLTSCHAVDYGTRENRLFENVEAAAKTFDELMNDTKIPLSYCVEILDTWYRQENEITKYGKGQNYTALRIPISRKDLPEEEIVKFLGNLKKLQLAKGDFSKYETIATKFLDHPNMPESLIQEQISNLCEGKNTLAQFRKWEYVLTREDIDEKYFFHFIQNFHGKHVSSYWLPLLEKALSNPSLPAVAIEEIWNLANHDDLTELRTLYWATKHKNCSSQIAFAILQSYKNKQTYAIFKEKTTHDLPWLEHHLDFILKGLGYDKETLASMPATMKAEMILW